MTEPTGARWPDRPGREDRLRRPGDGAPHAGVHWMLDNPSSGVLLPDDLPHEEILEIARPYLGPVVSESVDWSPLDDWQEPFPGAHPRPAAADAWQFGTFLVRGPQG